MRPFFGASRLVGCTPKRGVGFNAGTVMESRFFPMPASSGTGFG
jgi:hypothetical protein